MHTFKIGIKEPNSQLHTHTDTHECGEKPCDKLANSIGKPYLHNMHEILTQFWMRRMVNW